MASFIFILSFYWTCVCADGLFSVSLEYKYMVVCLSVFRSFFSFHFYVFTFVKVHQPSRILRVLRCTAQHYAVLCVLFFFFTFLSFILFYMYTWTFQKIMYHQQLRVKISHIDNNQI